MLVLFIQFLFVIVSLLRHFVLYLFCVWLRLRQCYVFSLKWGLWIRAPNHWIPFVKWPDAVVFACIKEHWSEIIQFKNRTHCQSLLKSSPQNQKSRHRSTGGLVRWTRRMLRSLWAPQIIELMITQIHVKANHHKSAKNKFTIQRRHRLNAEPTQFQ